MRKQGKCGDDQDNFYNHWLFRYYLYAIPITGFLGLMMLPFSVENISNAKQVAGGFNYHVVTEFSHACDNASVLAQIWSGCTLSNGFVARETLELRVVLLATIVASIYILGIQLAYKQPTTSLLLKAQYLGIVIFGAVSELLCVYMDVVPNYPHVFVRIAFYCIVAYAVYRTQRFRSVITSH